MWKLKGPGVASGWWPSAKTSRPMPFQQRTNTSWRSIRSQPAVSRRLFRCLGAHLLRSPSIVKSGLAVLAPVSASDGHTPSVEHDRSFSPISVSRSVTSLRCRFVSHSLDPFVSLIRLFMGNKKPCYHRGKQGLEILSLFYYLLTSGLSNVGS